MIKKITYLLLMILMPLMASANDDNIVCGDANGDGVVSMPDATAIMKQRWIEGRVGAFSVENVCKKLEDYRDLFIQSGAWARMVEHYDAQTYKPKYVSDLTREINFIEEWYKARFQQMDAYFGIE